MFSKLNKAVSLVASQKFQKKILYSSTFVYYLSQKLQVQNRRNLYSRKDLMTKQNAYGLKDLYGKTQLYKCQPSNSPPQNVLTNFNTNLRVSEPREAANVCLKGKLLKYN